MQELKAEELCPDVKGQYDFFKRTKIQLAGRISQEHLVKELEGRQQVLCILNSRKRVQRVCDSIGRPGDVSFIYLDVSKTQEGDLEGDSQPAVAGRTMPAYIHQSGGSGRGF